MSIRRFLDKNPDVVRFGKGILKVIGERKVSLKGKPEDIVKHAYDYERRGVEGSIESFFEERDRADAEKFAAKFKKERK